jgi:hypothetical protein
MARLVTSFQTWREEIIRTRGNVLERRERRTHEVLTHFIWRQENTSIQRPWMNDKRTPHQFVAVEFRDKAADMYPLLISFQARKEETMYLSYIALRKKQTSSMGILVLKQQHTSCMPLII